MPIFEPRSSDHRWFNHVPRGSAVARWALLDQQNLFRNIGWTLSVRCSTFVFLSLLLTGCVATHPTTRPVTDIDEKQAEPDYWWNQPAVAHASDQDFQKLWNACKGEMYVRLFPVDREQYRDGLLTSEPVISKQFFELWRFDAVNLHDVTESSLATIRRTIHFELKRLDTGGYEVAPKVLVERYVSTERRLTAFNQYHESFAGPHAFSDVPDESGVPNAAQYWYPLRRDADLENEMAASIRNRLGHPQS